MILDYAEQVKKFIQENFEPAEENKANLKWSNAQFRGFLFDVFPRNCISDYDLDEILTDLAYTRQTWVEDHTSLSQDDEGKEVFTISKRLTTGWCIRTHFDLESEIIKGH
jgi:hypothetical protein